MARTVAIGIQNFEDMIQKKCFYVDKTDFIREWWESEDAVTLIARPRRFGKTLNMSMLETFFSKRYQNRGELFEHLKIWQYEKYRKLQGTYPVITLSFANVKENSFEKAVEKIYLLLAELYSAHAYLLESKILYDEEEEYFRRIRSDMSEVDAVYAIHRLSDYLSRYYGKKVIILLDEYDTPMQEAYVNGYWVEFTSFIRNVFNAAFKTNPYLERALMTGITRVSKESIFSDLNNLAVITTTSSRYATVFGFTEEEVFAAMDEMELEDKAGVKYWYDGFVFGNVKDIYNPWSIINYLRENKFTTYWANTSSNSLVGKLIREGSVAVKKLFERLLQGEAIDVPVDEQIAYHNLDTNEGAIWSLLLATGYLKVLKYQTDQDYAGNQYEIYQLALTNEEVKKMFYRMVSDWFGRTGDSYNEFIKALIAGDLIAMNAYMKRVCTTVFSYFDTGKGREEAEPERFYHGFVLGLMVDMSKEYQVRSNRESGFGRYDVMIYPKETMSLKGTLPSLAVRKRNAMILEFKVHDPESKKELKDTVQEALAQIEEKNYVAELRALGFEEDNIKKYGFAFEGKKVLIGD